MINIDFLQYLIEYSKTENLSKACKSLHLSQSALTRAMQKIENYLGISIFEHSKNKLSLNETGKELVKNAQAVIDAENLMVEKTIAFHNKSSQIVIGSVAPGPIIKYGNEFYEKYKNKTIITKIEDEESLVQKLKDGFYDFIFLSHKLEEDNFSCKFAFKEELYVSVPKEHFVAGLKNGVYFKNIDGQSFLVSNNLGIWEKIVEDYLPNSKFFPQSMENLNEIIKASTIPSFVTNITFINRLETDRVNIPILDENAKVDFYVVSKNKNKFKI